MKRLYFRISFGVFVVLGISFFLPGVVLRVFESPENRKAAPQVSQATLEMLKNRLDGIPADQLSQQIDSLSLLLGYPLAIEDADRPMVPDREFDRADPNGPGSHSRPGPPMMIKLEKSNKLLIVHPNDRFRRPAVAALAVLVTIMLLITSVAGFIMVAPLMKNLRRLETAATRFGEGDLAARAGVSSGSAVGDVAKQFNVMADGIQQMIERERQLLQAVSHELRTPIARLRFSLDLLRNSNTQPESNRHMLEIDDEIEEIDSMVSELIDYNRLNSTQAQLHIERIDAAQLIDEVIERLRQFHSGIAVEVKTTGERPYVLLADPIKCRSAIQNLLLNALRYAHSRVVVHCERCDGALCIAVSDDGSGIPDAERERIFQPFVRVDDSRSKESGGVGLGLAIVHRIMQLHGGSVTVEPAEIGGAKFVTIWPDTTTPAAGN